MRIPVAGGRAGGWVAVSLNTLKNGRGHVKATRILPQIQDAEVALDVVLELQTAPLS